MPDWLKQLFPPRAWLSMLWPLASVMLAVTLAGVTVTCEGQRQHMSLGEFTEGKPAGLATAFLLPYGVEFSNGGRRQAALRAESSLPLGLLALLAGCMLAIRFSRRANEAYWLCAPYITVSLLAMLWLSATPPQRGLKLQFFPLLFYVVLAPLGCALLSRQLALQLEQRGLLELDTQDDNYGAVLQAARQGVRGSADELRSFAAAKLAPPVSADPPAGPSTGSRPPAPDLPYAGVHDMGNAGPPVPEAPRPAAAMNSAAEPAEPAEPAAAASPPQAQPVSYVAVCPFCGNRKVNHQRPGLCSMCSRNIAALLERPDAPRCQDCDGLLLAGAQFCHHCGRWVMGEDS